MMVGCLKEGKEKRSICLVVLQSQVDKVRQTGAKKTSLNLHVPLGHPSHTGSIG